LEENFMAGRVPPKRTDVVYPVRDGKPLGETGVHVVVLGDLIFTLRNYFRHQPDVYVIGNIFLYYEEGNPEARKSPDLMVVKGVEPGEERLSFKTWEERAVPCVVIEITSEETADEDLGPKRQLYEKLGVREYFLFDPLQEYLERPLMGYRLIGEKYEPLSPDNPGLLSAELGLRLVAEGSTLAFFRLHADERIPAPSEAYAMLEALQRASQAQQQLEQERRRAEQMAEELARLRERLPPAEGEAGRTPS
jgi:Uma2 family endonuclease